MKRNDVDVPKTPDVRLSKATFMLSDFSLACVNRSMRSTMIRPFCTVRRGPVKMAGFPDLGNVMPYRIVSRGRNTSGKVSLKSLAKMLEEKVKRFDYKFRDKCVEKRDYEALEMYVMELLMKE